MIWTIATVLIILWLLGLITSTMGGLIHVFLITAVMLILINIIGERKAL